MKLIPVVIIILLSVSVQTFSKERKSHAVILTGSPFSPFGKLEYQFWPMDHFSLRTGIVVGVAGVHSTPFTQTNQSRYYETTLIASPVLLNLDLIGGESPLIFSFGGLIVFQPKQFQSSDISGPGFDAAFTVGVSWQYAIPESNFFLSADCTIYGGLGRYPTKKVFSPWLGAGIGWRF